MADAVSPAPRVSVDGKFFRLAHEKFYIKGVAYGPFAPDGAGEPFASREQTSRDFELIRQLGANLIRIYHVPPLWFLDLAAERGLKVLIDIPWNKHLCFLDSRYQRQEAIDAVRCAVVACGRHPALFAFSVANEVPSDIVRWSGAQAVADFIDALIQEAKRVDPAVLCTFTSYPPTEFLTPQTVDFVCFNVYLHQPAALRKYLARLQMLSESKPLLLGEFGIDSLREGEGRKCEILEWQIETAFRAGLAGTIVFSFTDDWWRGGQRVDDWKMGLTTIDRKPKESFHSVARAFGAAPFFPLRRHPKVSVIVASYNSARTLEACLQSLERLEYPDYEVILVDDGSTDSTPQIAALHPGVRWLRHEKNLGLSAARNTGIAAAAGEIVAFIDSDCRADEHWLYYLVSNLLESEFAAIGGPNLLPPEDSPIAAAVMASPGGPTHVMLTDRQAEHIPGCNLACYKWTLAELGGFDPIFQRAGDDVDLCWRLQQAGYQIGFSPAAFVWHYRRSSLAEYLKQQRGYGEAEALLVRKHPEYFNSLGGSLWRGRIYGSTTPALLARRAVIYRGPFGSAGFQAIYPAAPAFSLLLCATFEYHVFINLPLCLLSVTFPRLLPLAIASVLLSLGVCAVAAAQARLPKNKTFWWSRPLVALLCLLQPLVRGWARYQGRLLLRPRVSARLQTLDSVALSDSQHSLRERQYWSETSINRLALVTDIVNRLDRSGWPNKPDTGWNDFDVEVYDGRWCKLQLATVAEEHPHGRQLIRCRLRPRWSLRAKALCATLVALLVLFLGFIGFWRWSWLLWMLPLPVFGWFLRRKQRDLQSAVTVFLDAVAKDWKLITVSPDARPPFPS